MEISYDRLKQINDPSYEVVHTISEHHRFFGWLDSLPDKTLNISGEGIRKFITSGFTFSEPLAGVSQINYEGDALRFEGDNGYSINLVSADPAITPPEDSYIIGGGSLGLISNEGLELNPIDRTGVDVPTGDNSRLLFDNNSGGHDAVYAYLNDQWVDISTRDNDFTVSSGGSSSTVFNPTTIPGHDNFNLSLSSTAKTIPYIFFDTSDNHVEVNKLNIGYQSTDVTLSCASTDTLVIEQPNTGANIQFAASPGDDAGVYINPQKFLKLDGGGIKFELSDKSLITTPANGHFIIDTDGKAYLRVAGAWKEIAFVT